MHLEKINVGGIPALVWGEPADSVFLYVHGKLSRKEEARRLAEIADNRGLQVVSFDLPDHGERAGKGEECSAWRGVEELRQVHEYVVRRWTHRSLFAVSFGAYISLIAFRDVAFDRALFVSPLLDMNGLIAGLMRWLQVSESELKERGRVENPYGEPLSWEYYTYAKAHPVDKWNTDTRILYGDCDNITSLEAVQRFVGQSASQLQVVPGAEHYFHTPEQLAILDQWMTRNV